jgi:hypothetical protein
LWEETEELKDFWESRDSWRYLPARWPTWKWKC